MQFKFQYSFFIIILKNLIIKKVDLIKNDDIKPDWLAIKWTKLWTRKKPTEINRTLINFVTSKQVLWAFWFWKL